MRIVTGIQPTGDLHLGNYLGAIRPLVDMQNAADDSTSIHAFVADLHTLSAKVDPDAIKAGTRQMTAALLACGVDMERTVLFRQSRVPAHAELALLLSGIARTGQLERMVQFKDKTAHLGENSEGPRLALFTYPVLQAADILLYRATHVPVGEDQRQHLQLAREVARKFNHDHARRDPVFTLPEAVAPAEGARVMSLQDGTSKMSKSDPADTSRITLMDDDDTIARKIRRAKSDMDMLPSEVEGLDGRPEARNLLTVHAALLRQTLSESVTTFGGRGFGDLKKDLANITIETFGRIGRDYRQIAAAGNLIEMRLEEGEEKARRDAAPVLLKAYQALGMR